MVGAGGHEDALALLERHGAALDLEHAAPVEDEVDLVVCVRLLAVGFRCDEYVDADLETG